MKRIYLIDCPGVVPPSQGDTEEDILLRGVVRVENVEHPAQYIEAVLRRTQVKHIERTYELKQADYDGDPMEFLSILARKGGRLLKGGEPDVDGVAKMVLNDFLRGKIPWFTPPPKKETSAEQNEDVVTTDSQAADIREGQPGEIPGTRDDQATIDGPAKVEGPSDDSASTSDFDSFEDDSDDGEGSSDE